MPPRRKDRAQAPKPVRAAAAAPAAAAPAPAPQEQEQITPEEAKRVPLMYTPTKKHALRELPLLALFVVAIVSVTLYFHYLLPVPKEATTAADPRPHAPISAGWYDRFFGHKLDAARLDMYAPEDAPNAPAVYGPLHEYFSEGNAMLTIQHLSEGIGYRVVGTQQHIDAEKWVQSILERYAGVHDTGDGAYSTKVELFTQFGDGAHRFDILGHPVWKQYYSMSNLIVRISDGSPESLENTLLLNAHIDSTLPSPGGADDGAGVAIMLELLRVLTLRGAPQVKHGIILLFNNGEESLQDASHMYMTQHNETNQNIRAVVNMEACGVSGPTLLFQATDKALIHAYGKVPHPFGTVLASDVFSSGLIMSDTDFRQFVEYGNGLPGLDMAIVGSSYLYHTRRDIPSHIERGVLQHFGENVFSLVDSLALEDASPLPGVRPWPFKAKQIMPIYFSFLGQTFVEIQPKTFKGMVIGTAVLANFFLSTLNSSEVRVNAISYALMCSLAVVGNLIAALLGANIVAALMRLLEVPMSWYAHEFYAMLLFVPPALAAIVGVQLVLQRSVEKTRQPYLEHSSFVGSYILFTFALMVMNMYGLGSAYLMLVAVVANLVPVVINDFLFVGFGRIADDLVAADRRVHFATYFISVLCASTIGAEGFVSFLDLIVPLMGRMGTDVPVDHVMASLVAVLTMLNSIAIVPLGHRYGAPFMKKTMILLVSLSVLTTAFFASPAVPTFDALHPRRLLVHHVENITSGEWHVAMSTLDAAPVPSAMRTDIEGVLLDGAPNTTLSWRSSPAAADMDILFPLTHFIDTQRLGLPATPARAAAAADTNRWRDFRLTCAGAVNEAESTREVTLRLVHPRLAWSTLSFDADVIDWDFPAPPPQGMRRHHLKDVSRLGADEFTMRIVVRMTPDELAAYRSEKHAPKDTLRRSPPAHDATPTSAWRLAVHYSGLDSGGMYPHHKSSGMDRLSMQDFVKLDTMLLEKYPEVDTMLMTVIAGVGEC